MLQTSETLGNRHQKITDDEVMLLVALAVLSAPSLLGARQHAVAVAVSDTSSLGAAVVRIEVASVPPSYLRPWEKVPQERMAGSGFIVDGRRILTNHHVIEGAVDIRVTKK